MKKVLTIIGPTATGKTDLSIKIAKRFNGEIISGDSIQVYKGMDIGSAKIKDTMGITHYGIDIISPFDTYSVYDFQKLSREKIDLISSNNKLPIICGGTGLYIKATLYDYTFTSIDNDEVLLKKYDSYSNKELYDLLKIKDPISYKKIHVNNRKRILRALILDDSGNNKGKNEDKQEHKLIYDSFIVGCRLDRDKLYKRINDRVIEMINEGLVNEIDNLLKSGVSFDYKSMSGIGYKEFRDYFEGSASLDETISLIQKNSRNFVKRQFTWFNNQMDMNWVNMDNNDEIEKLFKDIEKWIKA